MAIEKKAKRVNKQEAPNYPNGKFDLGKYAKEGFYGRCLAGDAKMVEHLQAPASQDDMMRNWVMTKVLLEQSRKHSKTPSL